jgi:hypothetical protein
MFAIRDERDYTVHEDFMKVGRGVGCGWLAGFWCLRGCCVMLCSSSPLHPPLLCNTTTTQAVRKMMDAKKLESTLNYDSDFKKNE